MNKDWIKWIFSILTVIIFLGSTVFVYIASFSADNTPKNNNAQVSGFAEVETTLSHYEPYLLINSSLNDSTIEKMTKNAQVDDVLRDKNGYVVLVRDRENVTSVYRYLKLLGLRATSFASLVLPENITIPNDAGSVVLKSNGNSIKYQLEPVFEENDKLMVRMVITGQDGLLAAYQSPVIVTKNVDTQTEAVVEKELGKTRSYSVPWEKRGSADILDLAGNSSYERANVVLFNRDLSPMEMIAAKNLSYVTFISERSATVNESFFDRERLIGDFALNTSDIVFPYSTLTLNSAGNATVTLDYPEHSLYEYEVSIMNMKTFSMPVLAVDREYAKGDKIKVKVTGIAIGERVQVTAIMQVQ